MKVTLESTNRTVMLVINGAQVPARLWEGSTANGIACHAFITRIAVAKTDDAAEFERDLQEHPNPRTPGLSDLFPHGIPTRLVI
jgi:hypothetical protein